MFDKFRFISERLIFLILIAMTVSCVNIIPSKQPTINSFTANTENPIEGSVVTLSWNVSDATSITITPDIGEVPTSGSRTVKSQDKTTYTLVASNIAGKTTKDVIVNKSITPNLQEVKRLEISTPVRVAPVQSAKKPDLIVSDFRGDQWGWLSYKVKNIGTASSSPCVNYLYRTGGPTIKIRCTDDFNVILAPGEEVARKLDCDLFSSPEIPYPFYIKVDANNKNDELNENNNESDRFVYSYK